MPPSAALATLHLPDDDHERGEKQDRKQDERRFHHQAASRRQK
jgi:hypothetical protein